MSKYEGPFWLVEAKPGNTAPPVSDTAADSLGNIAACLVPGDTVVGRMGPVAGAG